MANFPDNEVPPVTEKFQVIAHGATTLDVVYTNDVETVDRILDMYEKWLTEEKHKFLGLDIEYTSNRCCIAVFQLTMRKHVLIFHYCR
jgi:hypothetical protein